MPNPIFEPCPHYGPGVMVGAPRCRTCGADHEFSHWRLGMHEAMARYQYVYGFKPIGKHRKMTDELLGALRRTCERCQGAGILTLGRDRWSGCVDCEGTGGFWTCSPEEVERVRRRIRAEHPEAAVANPTARFIGGALAQYGKTGEMVDLEEEAATERRLAFQRWSRDRGVFLVERTWERLLAIGRAMTSETWADFRQALPPGEFESLHIWERNGGDRVYRDGDRLLFRAGTSSDPEEPPGDAVISSRAPFDPFDLPSVPDGDYPPWIEAIEATELPEGFEERFGERVDSFLNGSWWEFPVERLDEMVAELEERGYEVTISEVERRW